MEIYLHNSRAPSSIFSKDHHRRRRCCHRHSQNKKHPEAMVSHHTLTKERKRMWHYMHGTIFSLDMICSVDMTVWWHNMLTCTVKCGQTEKGMVKFLICRHANTDTPSTRLIVHKLRNKFDGGIRKRSFYAAQCDHIVAWKSFTRFQKNFIFPFQSNTITTSRNGYGWDFVSLSIGYKNSPKKIVTKRKLL